MPLLLITVKATGLEGNSNMVIKFKYGYIKLTVGTENNRCSIEATIYGKNSSDMVQAV